MANKKGTKDKHSTHNSILKTKARVTRTAQKIRVSPDAPEGQANPAPVVVPVVLHIEVNPSDITFLQLPLWYGLFHC